MRHLTFLALLAPVVGGCGQPAPKLTPEEVAKIDLKPVTVAELTAHVAAQKGKVVLIDCWSLT
jgi:hypothetical protein